MKNIKITQPEIPTQSFDTIDEFEDFYSDGLGYYDKIVPLALKNLDITGEIVLFKAYVKENAVVYEITLNPGEDTKQLLEQALDLYEDNELYEKCIEIKKVLDERF